MSAKLQSASSKSKTASTPDGAAGENTPPVARKLITECMAPRLWEAEQATSDARQMPNGVINLYQGGEIASAGNQSFVAKIIETVVSPAERDGLINASGVLNEAGIRRIENALFAKAYENISVLGTLGPRGPPVRTLISKRQLLQLIPLSFSSIWTRMRKGEFPLSCQLDDAGSKSFWYLDEVSAWIESRPRSQLKPLPAEAEPAEAAA